MSDPIQVHRIRLAYEFNREIVHVSHHDLEYLLHAYDTMIDALVEIQECSTTLQTTQLATDCLNRIDYIGPTY